jgi:hypothetical protein
MELIILGLGGAMVAVLSQLLEFISQWRPATSRPLLNPHRPNVECHVGLRVNLKAVALRQRLPSTSV